MTQDDYVTVYISPPRQRSPPMLDQGDKEDNSNSYKAEKDVNKLSEPDLQRESDSLIPT